MSDVASVKNGGEKERTARQTDQELGAMAKINRVITQELDDLSLESQKRVKAWLKSRHFGDEPTALPKPPTGSEP